MDLKPFEPFYDYTKKSINKLINNIQDTEDIFQDVLIYLWNKPETFINYPKTYINNLGKWIAIKYKSENTLHLDDFSNLKCNNISVFNSESGWNLFEIDDNIFNKLNNIPKKYLDPLILKILDKKSIKEISIELKLNENTVKTNIKRAKEYLAK